LNFSSDPDDVIQKSLNSQPWRRTKKFKPKRLRFF